MVAPVVVASNHNNWVHTNIEDGAVFVESSSSSSAPPPTTTENTTTNKPSNGNGNNSSIRSDTNSTNSKTSSSSTSRATHLMSHSLHDNMLQKHHKDDPLQFYTIEAVLGEGSMVCMSFLARVSCRL
jgi:hypothetical protein